MTRLFGANEAGGTKFRASVVTSNAGGTFRPPPPEVTFH